MLLTSLQDSPYECLGSQSQVWQPPPLAMFQVLGAQRSQCWPITLGRQWHWPLLRSQWQSPDDGQLEGSLPSRLQTHSVDCPVQLLTRACVPAKPLFFLTVMQLKSKPWWGGGGRWKSTGEFSPVLQLQPSLPSASTVIDGLRHALEDRRWVG